jgi:hypothetical protein
MSDEDFLSQVSKEINPEETSHDGFLTLTRYEDILLLTVKQL